MIRLILFISLVFLMQKSFGQQADQSTDARKRSLSFSYSHITLFPSGSANTTNPVLDLSDYHKKFGFTFIRKLKNNFAAEFGLGVQIIPKKKSIDSISWTPGEGLGGIRGSAKGKGGVIIPITGGIRKYFRAGPLSPYVRCAPGLLFMKIGAGKASGGKGEINKEVDIQTKLSPYIETGTGVQLTMSRSTRFDIGFNGFFTPRFSSPIGNYMSYSGWNITVGLNFILKNRK